MNYRQIGYGRGWARRRGVAMNWLSSEHLPIEFALPNRKLWLDLKSLANQPLARISEAA
jgi:hypothetical protein